MHTSLETNRLRLRQWQASDQAPFAQLNADPEVMRYFPATLSTQQSHALIERIASGIDSNGWGFWAIEVIASTEFAGFVGLNEPTTELPFTPCVEIGWRLAKRYWGKGYATEAATMALAFAFETLQLAEVVSFTPRLNLSSQAVMHRIGMTDTRQNFLHPGVPPESQLREHILFKITNAEWDQR